MSDPRFHHELQRYWDEVRQGGPATPGDLDPSLTETIRRLQTADVIPSPDPRRMQQLREELMNVPLVSFVPDVGRPPVANGHAAPPWRAFIPALPAQRGRRWALAQAATALLVLVTLLAVYFAFRPERHSGVVGPESTPTTIPAPTPAEVTRFHGDDARTGAMPGPAPAEPVGIAWRTEQLGPGDRIWSSPVLAGGLVYVATATLDSDRPATGALHAIDASTGAIRWSFEPGGTIPGTATVAGRTVYIAAGGDGTEGAFYALDAATGQERWRAKAGYGRKWGAPVVAGDTVVLADGLGVRAFDAATGEARWRFNPQSNAFPQPASSAIAVRDGVVYAPIANSAGTSSVVVALDVATGEERWNVRLQAPLEPIVVAIGMVYLGATNPNTGSGGIHALDAATGEERWHVETTAGVRATPALANGVLYVAEMGGTVQALDATTGERRWSSVVSSSDLFASPALAGSTLYVARGGVFSDAAPTGQGTVYALDTATGATRWELSVSAAGIVSSPIVANGFIYVGCDDGRLYALGHSDGAATPASPSA